MLLSFLLSQADWRRTRDILDLEQQDRLGIQSDPPKWFNRKQEFLKNPFIIITKFLNFACLISFGIGVFSLLYFCKANLPYPGEESMAKQTETTKATPKGEQKGSTSHKPPVRPVKTSGDEKK